MFLATFEGVRESVIGQGCVLGLGLGLGLLNGDLHGIVGMVVSVVIPSVVIVLGPLVGFFACFLRAMVCVRLNSEYACVWKFSWSWKSGSKICDGMVISQKRWLKKD